MPTTPERHFFSCRLRMLEFSGESKCQGGVLGKVLELSPLCSTFLFFFFSFLNRKKRLKCYCQATSRAVCFLQLPEAWGGTVRLTLESSRQSRCYGFVPKHQQFGGLECDVRIRLCTHAAQARLLPCTQIVHTALLIAYFSMDDDCISPCLFLQWRCW